MKEYFSGHAAAQDEGVYPEIVEPLMGAVWTERINAACRLIDEILLMQAAVSPLIR